MLERESEAIRSCEDLSRFVGLLEQDLHDHPKECENRDLPRYLESLYP